MIVNMIKFIGAWVCIILAVGFMVIGHSLPVLPQVLAILAIAFATAPATW